MHAIDANTGEDLWVFGYGSLMWRPGFDFIERVPARLIGLHRALCVYSFVHRGTPERPGLVLGLDRGGMCRGIAFRVAAAARAATVAYLRSREQVTTVYLETLRRIELEEEARRQVRALCFIVDRSHVQYAGRLTLDECLHHVRQGHGSSGANRDYVIETARALEALGYRETDLHLITERLGGSRQTSIRHRIKTSVPLDSDCWPSATSRAVASSSTLCRRSEECAPVEAGLDRVKDFNQDVSGITAQGTARPEQSGIQRDRYAGQAGLSIKIGDAGQITRLGTRSASCAFWKDDDLARMRNFLAHACRHARKRCGARAAIDRNHPRFGGKPAEQRYPHQFALEDVGRIGQQHEQRECLPQRLVLAGDDVGALWKLLASAPLDVDVADHAQQPQRAAAVAPQHTEHEATRQQQGSAARRSCAR